MKAIQAIIATFLFNVIGVYSRSFIKRTQVSRNAPVPAQPAAPAPAAPKLPGLEALHITFELSNFNYFDLTKVTCPQKVKVQKKKQKQSGPIVQKKEVVQQQPRSPLGDFEKALKDSEKALKEADKATNLKPVIEDIKKQSGSIEAEVGKAQPFEGEQKGGFASPAKQEKKAAMKKKKHKKHKKQAASLLEVAACGALPDLTVTNTKECATVMDVLRRVIKEVVQNIIKCEYLKSLRGASPAPAAAPAAAAPSGDWLPVPVVPVASPDFPTAPPDATGLVPLPPQGVAPSSFLSKTAAVQAPPAPAPVAVPLNAIPSDSTVPDVDIFVTFYPGKKIEGGATTIVEIAFIDAPKNGRDDIQEAIRIIDHAIESGHFVKRIEKALLKVTGVMAIIKDVGHNMKVIEHWPVEKCEAHIRGIVQQFTLHYTHDQVPRALHNECTNFLTKMSFSHDYILDPMDTVRCRQATSHFTEHWEKGEKFINADFEPLCVEACEAKYGIDAPTCNLYGGKGLAHQPLL